MRPPRDGGRGQNTAQSAGHRHGLHLGHGMQTGAQPVQRRVDRGPVDAGGKGEAIVGQRRRAGQGGRAQRQCLPRGSGQFRLVPDAEDPALFRGTHVDHLLKVVRIQPRKRRGHKLNLQGVPHGGKTRGLLPDQFLVDHVVDERVPDFHYCHRAGQEFEGPDGDRMFKPPPQPGEHGEAGHHLPTDGARTGHLPAGEGALGQRLGLAPVGERIGIALLGARQARDVTIAEAVGPERALALAQRAVDLARQIEARVELRRVRQPGFQPLPYGEGIRLSGQRLRETFRVGEGKVEPDAEPTARGQFLGHQFADPVLGQRPVPEVERRLHAAGRRDAGPDRIPPGTRAGVVAARPVDHREGVEGLHNPTSDRMKSAMAFVSSRSKTGRASSSATSLATARIDGSPGAIRSCPATCRKASILGCASRL